MTKALTYILQFDPLGGWVFNRPRARWFYKLKQFITLIELASLKGAVMIPVTTAKMMTRPRMATNARDDILGNERLQVKV